MSLKSFQNYCCFILCFLFSNAGFSQQEVSGIVIDENKEPLAFVNILINGDYSKGQSTDIDGRFKIQTKDEISRLSLSYVGFENLDYELKSEDQGEVLSLVMKRISADLPEALIIAGENPAHRIIRKVVENKDLNNPEKMQSFQCQTYNKMTFEWMPNEKNFKEWFEEKGDTSKNKLAKTRIENYNKFLKDAEERHLFVMESVSDRKFMAPDRNNEVVTHNRVSGLKHPSFVALANDIQPFSFYNTYLDILGKSFLNPISPKSTDQYFFNIEDSLFQNQDTVFIISYHPRKGKNFEGLEGVLYIHSNGYALQNVIARPYDKSFIHMKLEQRYVLIDEKQWFPEQLNFVIEATKYPHKTIGSRVSGKSYISQVKLNPSLKKKEFRTNGYITAKDANTQNDSIWEAYRPQDLTEREEETYVFMDSLGAKKNFDAYLNVMEALASGRYPVGKFDILINHILSFNDYEGTRIGFGLATNDRLSRHVELGGYGGYGVNDKAWKYGGYLDFKILNDKRLNLRFDYNKDIREPGLLNFYSNESIFNRRLYAKRMDTWENKKVSLSGKLKPFTYFNLNFAHEKWKPNYEYSFLDYDVNIDEFDFTEIGLDLRFTFREKILRFLGTEESESKYPIVFLSFKKGFVGLLNGGIAYDKVIASVEDDFRIRNLGTTAFRIEAGWTKGNIPFPKLFSASGIGRGFQWIEIDNTFQTMDLYEFLSDRFVHLFFEHNFESHLLKVKNWKPEISIVQHVGFGSLERPDVHSLIEFKTMEKGYLESGIRVDNLYRFNYVNLLYLGIGGGIYYRYGNYALPEMAENFAYRFRLSMSF